MEFGLECYDGSKPIEGVQDPELIYCTDLKSSDAALKKFTPGEPLGMDCEWTVSFKKNVQPGKIALVQLCSKSQTVLLHASRMSRIPDRLIKILADPNTPKIGVNIKNDGIKFFND